MCKESRCFLILGRLIVTEDIACDAVRQGFGCFEQGYDGRDDDDMGEVVEGCHFGDDDVPAFSGFSADVGEYDEIGGKEEDEPFVDGSIAATFDGGGIEPRESGKEDEGTEHGDDSA